MVSFGDLGLVNLPALGLKEIAGVPSIFGIFCCSEIILGIGVTGVRGF